MGATRTKGAAARMAAMVTLGLMLRWARPTAKRRRTAHTPTTRVGWLPGGCSAGLRTCRLADAAERTGGRGRLNRTTAWTLHVLALPVKRIGWIRVVGWRLKAAPTMLR